MSGTPIEVWRGSVNSWECDHLGHMNTRFYLARVEEGLAALAAGLGLGQVAPADGSHSLMIRAQHMRFHREARAGTALHATGQILSWGGSEAGLLFVLRHSESDQVAATFRLAVCHLDRKTAALAPWPTEVTEAAQSLICEIPNEARPRSVSLDDAKVSASLEQARKLGLQRTGLGAITAEVCDPRGVWRLSGFMGRVADSVPHLRGGDWRAVLERTAPGGPLRVGSALVEFQTVHLRWPRLGDGCEVRSGLAGCSDRVTYSAHWLLDPLTGAAWGAVRTVGVALDLDARRTVALTMDAQEAYRAVSVPGLIF